MGQHDSKPIILDYDQNHAQSEKQSSGFMSKIINLGFGASASGFGSGGSAPIVDKTIMGEGT